MDGLENTTDESTDDHRSFELPAVGHYRVGTLLGLGGISGVYLAVDQRNGQRVALKISLRNVGRSMTPDRDCHVTQFYAEWNALCWVKGRQMAGCALAGVPQVFEHGLVRSVLALASEPIACSSAKPECAAFASKPALCKVACISILEGLRQCMHICPSIEHVCSSGSPWPRL